MILYSDDSSFNLVNSIYEKDFFGKIPSDYALNLLTINKNKPDSNNTIKFNNKITIANRIQRGLINLLPNEIETSTIREKSENPLNGQESNSENNVKNLKLINNKEIMESFFNKNKNNLIDNKTNFNNEFSQNLKSNNNVKYDINNNENSDYKINQHIYNNINFIYNIGINDLNNQNLSNNNHINNNINNFNNTFFNSFNFNPKIIQNFDNQPNNNNDYYNNINNVNNFTYYEMKENNNNFENQNSNNKISHKDNKYLNMTLQEIANKLDSIAKKKHGCKFLENFLNSKENSSEIINKIFYPKLYWAKLYELCNDLFGNYFIQSLIPKLNDNNLISFTNLVADNLLNLCLNPHGTRVVQSLIDNIKDNKFNLLLIFKGALSEIIDNLINNLNGSFVLIHYAKKIQDNDMIYNYIINNIIEVVTNSYSCSALQKLIDIANNQQKQNLFNSIIDNTNNLVGNQCGLYVIQFIMSKNNYYINDLIAGQIINKIIYYSKRKYSSNVIEKCLETCSKNMVNKIINILNKESIIRDLTNDIFGNYVIQKLLAVCPNDQIRNQILKYVAIEFKNLKNIVFGPKLMDKIIRAYPQIQNYL